MLGRADGLHEAPHELEQTSLFGFVVEILIFFSVCASWSSLMSRTLVQIAAPALAEQPVYGILAQLDMSSS